jgi:hypothetical protein
LNQSGVKVEKNERELSKKKEKAAEVYNKHLDEIYRRYQSEEKKSREQEKD